MHEPQGEPVNKWGSQPKFYKELLQFILSESTGVGCKPVLTQCKGHTRLRLLKPSIISTLETRNSRRPHHKQPVAKRVAYTGSG